MACWKKASKSTKRKKRKKERQSKEEMNRNPLLSLRFAQDWFKGQVKGHGGRLFLQVGFKYQSRGEKSPEADDMDECVRKQKHP